jgi:hypothetical protein
MSSFVDAWNAQIRRREEARRRRTAPRPQSIEVLYVRPARVAPPIAIREDEPETIGFSPRVDEIRRGTR